MEILEKESDYYARLDAMQERGEITPQERYQMAKHRMDNIEKTTSGFIIAFIAIPILSLLALFIAAALK